MPRKNHLAENPVTVRSVSSGKKQLRWYLSFGDGSIGAGERSYAAPKDPDLERQEPSVNLVDEVTGDNQSIAISRLYNVAYAREVQLDTSSLDQDREN